MGQQQAQHDKHCSGGGVAIITPLHWLHLYIKQFVSNKSPPSVLTFIIHALQHFSDVNGKCYTISAHTNGKILMIDTFIAKNGFL